MTNIRFKIEEVDQIKHAVIYVEKLMVVVDREDFERLCKYKWHLRHIKGHAYAYRYAGIPGQRIKIFMHREIMRCGYHKIVHHKNHYGLDNRKQNLQIMTWLAHKKYHQTN